MQEGRALEPRELHIELYLFASILLDIRTQSAKPTVFTYNSRIAEQYVAIAGPETRHGRAWVLGDQGHGVPLAGRSSETVGQVTGHWTPIAVEGDAADPEVLSQLDPGQADTLAAPLMTRERQPPPVYTAEQYFMNGIRTAAEIDELSGRTNWERSPRGLPAGGRRPLRRHSTELRAAVLARWKTRSVPRHSIPGSTCGNRHPAGSSWNSAFEVAARPPLTPTEPAPNAQTPGRNRHCSVSAEPSVDNDGRKRLTG